MARVKLTKAYSLGGRDGVMASTSILAAMPISFVILEVWNIVQDFPTVREMFLFQSPVNLLDPT